MKGKDPVLVLRRAEHPVSDIVSDSELPEILHTLYSSQSPLYYFEDDYIDRIRTGRAKPANIEEYNSPSGSYISITSFISLVIQDITILGVPFSLSAKLVVSPGFAIYSPDKVIAESTGRYTFPFVLSEMSLFSDSRLLKEKAPELYALFSRRYGHLAGGTQGDYALRMGLFQAWDNHGNEFQANDDRRDSMTIWYTSNVEAEMNDLYQTFLNEEEERLQAEKLDLSDQL